jgi:CDP-6-deoxy-D-xylo-4-hexulose-3-dehydrase
MCGHRFDGTFGDLPKGYDHKYVYSHFGYNLKVTDMQAAVGCAQLKKLPSFVEKRRHNFKYLLMLLNDTADQLILPQAAGFSNPSWFGFVITCREQDRRDKLVSYLEQHGIQTRMLFAGNIIKHPCFNEMREEMTGYRVVGKLDNTDRIMRDTFWIGVYPGMTDEMLLEMSKRIHEGLKL